MVEGSQSNDLLVRQTDAFFLLVAVFAFFYWMQWELVRGALYCWLEFDEQKASSGDSKSSQYSSRRQDIFLSRTKISHQTPVQAIQPSPL
jgi:hypothetical protein